MQLDRELAKRETEARAAAAPARTLIETVEDVRSVVLGYAGAGVDDPDDHRALERLIRSAFDADLTATRRVLDRIREQIGEHANDERIVDEDRGIRGERGVELDPLGERLGGHLRQAALGQSREPDDLGHRLELALLHLVDVEKGVDHPQQLADVRFRESQELVEVLTAGLQLSHSHELHECDDAVGEVPDVMAEHADELFA